LVVYCIDRNLLVVQHLLFVSAVNLRGVHSFNINACNKRQVLFNLRVHWKSAMSSHAASVASYITVRSAVFVDALHGDNVQARSAAPTRLVLI